MKTVESARELARTMVDLGQDAGVTTGTVSLLERGLSNPAWGTVKALADGLGVTVAELAKVAARHES